MSLIRLCKPSRWPQALTASVKLLRPIQIPFSNRRDPAQAESGFAEIVSDDLPIFHLELCSRHCLLFKTSPNDSEQHAGNDSSPSQEGFVEIKLTYHHRLCRTGRVFPL
jgi:hypothetical protein